MHKNITKQLAAAVKNKRCWFTFCTTFVVALCGMVVILRHSDVNASLSPSFSSLESIENEIYNEEFSEPDNDFIAEEFASAEEPVEPEPTEETRENTVSVKKGDTLLNILTDLGLEYGEANEIFLAAKKVYDPRDLKAGQKLQISMEWNLPENKLIAVNGISTQIRSGEHLVIEKNEEGKYVAELQKDELIEEINSAGGTINGSLAGAMNGEKVPAGIVANFINIFSYSVDFRRDVKKGDKFEIIYQNYITPDGEVVKNGNILFASLTLGKNKIDLYRFKDKSGNVDYYDAKGYAMKKTLSRKPMSYQNARISSAAGVTRSTKTTASTGELITRRRATRWFMPPATESSRSPNTTAVTATTSRSATIRNIPPLTAICRNLPKASAPAYASNRGRLSATSVQPAVRPAHICTMRSSKTANGSIR